MKKEQCPHPDGQVRARVGAQKKGKLSGLGFWPDSEASCDVHASLNDEINVKGPYRFYFTKKTENGSAKRHKMC